jgi:signal transduction histidine kinase
MNDGSRIHTEACRDNPLLRLTQDEVAHPTWTGLGNRAQAAPPMHGLLAVPLVDRKGNNIGLIKVSGKRDGDFTQEDEAVLVQLASIASTGFENARLYGSLKEQHRRKDEFLAMLAHELRNPLAPITSAAHLLQFKAGDELQVRRLSEVILRQASHMTSLVNDLLDVSRATHGLIQLDTATLDPMVVVDRAVEQSQPLITESNLELIVEGHASGVSIIGDQVRLTQVLVNLLNNASKYTPAGGRIWLSISYRSSVVSISVRDSGIGIDAGLLPQVFDLFTQAERLPDRAQSGLGIGLALVREIITLHGGQVTAESDGLGAGSRFTISLSAIEN